MKTLLVGWQREGLHTLAPSEPSYRRTAAFVTGVAAVAIFALGLVLQLMTYELFESYSQHPLPTISKPLFENFGYRATSYLVHTTFWLWWPFLWAFLHTHFYYPENQSFGRVYLHRLVFCISLSVLYAAAYSIVAAIPRILLLADLSHQPSILMKFIPIVSQIMPLFFLGLIARWAYKTSAVFRDKDGVFRVSHKYEKEK